MNKCSTYVLKHILSFIGDRQISILSGLNRLFRTIIDGNIAHKINVANWQYLEQLSLKVLKESGDRLDVIQRENGLWMFFIVDDDRNDLTFKFISDLIKNNISLFVDLGISLDWKIDKNSLEFYYIRVDDIDHKHLVKPFRTQLAEYAKCCAIPLYYYPYIEMNDDYDGYNAIYDYEINLVKFVTDMYADLLINHSNLIRENPTYVFKRSMKHIDRANDKNIRWRYSCLENEMRDNKTKAMYDESLHKLIEDRNLVNKIDAGLVSNLDYNDVD